jgi:hypothetical protein
MEPPVDLGDAEGAQVLRRRRAARASPIPVVLAPMFFLGPLGVVAGPRLLHLGWTGSVVACCALAAVSGSLAWSGVRSLLKLEAGQAHDTLRHEREVADSGYPAFLFFGALFLSLVSLAASFFIHSIMDSAGAPPIAVTMTSMSLLVLLAFVAIFFSVFAGLGRSRYEDEMVAAHRSQAYGVGFVASAACALALAVIAIVFPQFTQAAAAPLVVLPLIIAMVWLGLLERAAIVKD